MKVKVKALLDVLTFLQPGLSTKEVIEGSDSFIFQNNYVWTYNDEISVCCPFQLGKEDFVVPAKPLFNLLKRSKDEEVEIKVSSSEMKIIGSKAEAGITVSKNEMISKVIDTLKPPKKWRALPADFGKAVKAVLNSVSRDASRPILTCVHIYDEMVESCDNYRVTQAYLDAPIGDELLLPGAAAKELIKHNTIEWGQNKGWAHFRNKTGIIFSCRTMKGDYPDIEPFLEIEGDRVKFPPEITEILERTNVFVDADSGQEPIVTITLDKKKCTLKGVGPNGWYTETAKSSWKGSPLTIAVNPSWFKEVVANCRLCVIGENKLVFSNDEWKHMLMLAENA